MSTATGAAALIGAHGSGSSLGLEFVGDGAVGSTTCAAAVNSTGVAAVLVGTGSATVASNNFALRASALPLNAFGFSLASRTPGFVPNPGGRAGNLCLGGSIGRYVGPGQIKDSGAAGALWLTLDLAATPTPTGPVAIAAGRTWDFQAWYRDAAGGAATSNFAGGLSVLFQ